MSELVHQHRAELEGDGLETASAPEIYRHDPLLRSFDRLEGKIGIFGGTFDPLHNAHLVSAEAARVAHNLDMVVFIPAKQNPLKENAPVADDQDRLCMIRDALVDYPCFFVSDIEIQADQVSYTRDTLKQVRASVQQDAEIFLIAGADILDSFHNWLDHKFVAETAELVFVTRGQFRYQDFERVEERLGTELTTEIKENFVSIPEMELSSTELRAAHARGEDISLRVPPAVLKYINDENLYRTE